MFCSLPRCRGPSSLARALSSSSSSALMDTQLSSASESRRVSAPRSLEMSSSRSVRTCSRVRGVAAGSISGGSIHGPPLGDPEHSLGYSRGVDLVGPALDLGSQVFDLLGLELRAVVCS